MLADGVTKALPEPKHTMIFRRCMRPAPSGDFFACIIANDLEALLYYIIIITCTFTFVFSHVDTSSTSAYKKVQVAVCHCVV
jgi:hypothetical protein